MVFLDFLWLFIQIVLLTNLLLPILFYVLFKLKDETEVDAVLKSVTSEADYAVIVTAYEDISMIPAVLNSLLNMNYENYVVYVVADNCDISTLQPSSNKVLILKPETILAGNVRSHFYAINHFIRKHDRLTIIDSDNVVHPEYLNELEKYFQVGFEAVQGVRKAKNMNTLYATLDAARDLYYHFYDGKVLFNLSSSATLAGSGMAFTVDLYKRALGDKNVIGAGFDKVLQYEIVSRNKRIAFSEKAVVFDEKTAKKDQLVKQRARWINTWFKYVKFGVSLLKDAIVYRSVNPFLFGLVLLRPPLFIFLFLSIFFLLANVWLGYWVQAAVLFVSLVCFVGAFLIALKEGKADKRIYKALLGVPRFMFYQFKALFYAKKANKISVATKHDYHGSIKKD